MQHNALSVLTSASNANRWNDERLK